MSDMTEKERAYAKTQALLEKFNELFAGGNLQDPLSALAAIFQAIVRSAPPEEKLLVCGGILSALTVNMPEMQQAILDYEKGLN